LKQILLETRTGNSCIRIDDSLKNLRRYVSGVKRVIITDHDVRKLYGELFPSSDIIELGKGEKVKTLRTVESIYGAFLNLELDRASFIIGIGGGIVCDITGFCASTYMRGVRFGLVPTTLLAQVDAAIGGKNGVNFEGYKNTIGVVSQPEFVLVDFSLLETLPETEYNCGIAEIVKSALIKNEELFLFLEDRAEEISGRDLNALKKAAGDAIAIKTEIVRKDVADFKERRLLNFGHTIGHALEKATGVSHGKAVSIGMALSASFSETKGMLSKDTVSRIETLLQKFHLPTRTPVAADSIIEAIKKDKKRHDEDIDFVCLERIGKAELAKIPRRELEAWIHDMHKHC